MSQGQAKLGPIIQAPIFYELNTRCWLRALSDEAGRTLSLNEVPESEFQLWHILGFTHIWLMGVWTVGPLVRAHALKHHSKYEDIDSHKDLLGSSYAISDYRVSEALGGERALGAFKAKLHTYGLKLILDFIPNHVGLDHPWVAEHPHFFVQGRLHQRGTFCQPTRDGKRWLAHGRDPYFSPWSDTAQLDYRKAETHAAVLEQLQRVSALCDGVRCDMAMLIANEVFTKTWADFPWTSGEAVPEFWPNAIKLIKQKNPEFLFIGEVYWGLEARLQALGFDYTYEKTTYDLLIKKDPEKLQSHLLTRTEDFLNHSLFFLENHDEQRIAFLLNPEQHKAAAALLLSLPGSALLHEGQLEGLTKQVSVHVGRRAVEQSNREVNRFYTKVLRALRDSPVRKGWCRILEPRAAWSGNPSHNAVLLFQWQVHEPFFDLAVINLAPHRSQCFAPVIVPEAIRAWELQNRLGKESYVRNTSDLISQGLYLDLPAFGAQLFAFRPE